MTVINAQQVLPFRQPDANGIYEERIMIDFARNPVGQQAVRLNRFTAPFRFLCRVLCIKGNPELKA